MQHIATDCLQKKKKIKKGKEESSYVSASAVPHFQQMYFPSEPQVQIHNFTEIPFYQCDAARKGASIFVSMTHRGILNKNFSVVQQKNAIT